MTDFNTYVQVKALRKSRRFYWLAFSAIMLFTCFVASQVYGQAGMENSWATVGFNRAGTGYRMYADTVQEKNIEENNYDEILITLNVTRVGSVEIPAIIYNQMVYLPIKDVFDFLKIKNTFSADLSSIEGFFISPKSAFVIDKSKTFILYEEKTFPVKRSDLIQTETNLYLRSEFFGNVFGLDCTFDFRSLSVTLNTKVELPVIREMQQEQMRRNMIRLKGEKKADTTLKMKYSFFHLGMADWSVVHTQESGAKGNTRVNLNLGAQVAGGEANAYLNYDNLNPVSGNQQFYRWRLVNNENAFLRQITAGNIYTQSTASVYKAVNGVQFTNAPTTYRRSFGTYRLSNTTEPGWTVELYVNNVLVNYTKADASGFFTFDVPLVYGTSVVKLRFFGPWGEERTREQNINIPFNFLPLHQFEYTLSAGIVSDEDKSRFSRLNMNYGLGNRITIGGGMEYLSSVASGTTMPYVNASARLGTNLLISGEHTYGVRSKGVASYRLPSNFQVEVNYIKYEKGQTAIKSGQKSISNYLEERKIMLSVPIHARHLTAFSRLSVNQLVLPNTRYTNAEFLLSGVYSGVSTNFTTSAVYSNPAHPLVYSNVSFTFRLPKGIRFSPQAQWEYTQKNFTSLKGEVEKNLLNRGFLTMSYERNNTLKSNIFSVGLRYNFSFAQTAASITGSRSKTSTVQSARGSLLFDDVLENVKLSNQTNVGKGGLLIIPFLDFNCNGKRDDNEPRVSGLKVRVNGGRIVRNDKDTAIQVIGLESYANYYVELDKNSFDNIAWQIKKPTLNVTIEPNHFKYIEVPVSVMGEVSGTVYLNKNNEENGIGRIIVNIYNSDSSLAARTLSEPDGYFSFLGLAPGTYTASIDAAQLAKLHMTCADQKTFTIQFNKEGDLVDGMKFVLQTTDTGKE